MRIWEYTTDSDHYYTLTFVDYQRDKWIIDANLNAEPIPEPFPPIAVRYETNWKDLSPSQRRLLRKGNLPKGDFPSLLGVEVIFSKKALEVLGPLIQNSVQVIPLQCEEDRLYLIHVIDVVDCLDLERSTVDYILGGPLISHVVHYEFKNLERLEGKGIFKIHGIRVATFVTDTFKALVETHNLRGLLWKPLP